MATAHAPPQGRSWLWYFIGVALLAVVLVGWLYLFIQAQTEPGRQLKREQLVAARDRFKSKNFTDYQMLYTVQRGGSKTMDTYFVEVRGGQVVTATLNQKPVPLVMDELDLQRLSEQEKQELWRKQIQNRSMMSLFNDIEIFLKMDEKPDAAPTYRRAWFDNDDGHLIRFQRQVIGGTERVEIKVEEFKPAPAPGPAPLP